MLRLDSTYITVIASIEQAMAQAPAAGIALDENLLEQQEKAYQVTLEEREAEI